MSVPRLCGIVLAAGAGRRFGGPKALARDADGTPWIVRAVEMLRAAGCADVLVTLGQEADEAAALAPAGAVVVRVPDWREGVAASLRAGLGAAVTLPADAVVVTPVDTPDAPASAVARVVEAAVARVVEAAVARVAEAAGAHPASAATGVVEVAGAKVQLAQAMYDGVPGHPVLIGRAHWHTLAATIAGDIGARPYLVAHGVIEVECGDLWSGADIDVLPAGS